MSVSASDVNLIKEGDFVFLNGGGAKRMAEVKKNLMIRLGRSGTAFTSTLVGLRFGEIVRLDHGSKRFLACNDYPDLDISELHETENKDNRNLMDDNRSQLLSNTEVADIRQQKGIAGLLSSLVESSTTYEAKTSFSKEKYLRKKQKKYGALFKVERVTPDIMAEIHLPTVNPSDDQPEDAHCVRLRADTVALILHHSGVHANSRVLVYDHTNGALESYLLTRLGPDGRIFQILDKSAQPNTFPARQLGLQGVKERWKAVPRNPGFLEGVEEEKEMPSPTAASSPEEGGVKIKARLQNPSGFSQWVRGLDARNELLAQPADSVIVVDNNDAESVLADLLPYVAYGGHVVVYSPFLEDLSGLFLKLRNDCINIRISETWYRHHQVLPQRTHPTVNMSTAAGYLLTAIKVMRNPNPRPRFANADTLFHSPTSAPPKRMREEDKEETTIAHAGGAKVE